VAHVGIERLHAGDGQDDGTQHEEARQSVVEEEARRMPGVEPPQNVRTPRDLDPA
jgi:hypothetical protein